MTVTTDTPHSGAQAARAVATNGKAFASGTLSPQSTEVTASTALLIEDRGTAMNVLRLSGGGGAIATVYIASNGTLALRNDVAARTGTGTINSSSNVAVSSSTWHTLDVTLSISTGANDSISISLDTNPVASLTKSGIELGDDAVNKIVIGDNSSGRTFSALFDDVAVTAPSGGGIDLLAPTAPGNLRTSDVTTTTADLAWDASTDDVGVTGYDITRDGAPIGSVDGSTTTFHDEGLTPSTPYDYAVVARDAAGHTSSPSTLVVTTDGVVAPTAPSGTLSGAASSIWQTNGTVWAMAVANGKLYVGGDFTSVRPPGSPAGSNEVPRNHIAAFDAQTGALVSSFSPSINGAVREITASPNGSRIYVGGVFRTVDGIARNRLAAFDTTTGALLTTWKPSSSAAVSTIATYGSTVYIGGSFTSLGNATRNRLAAVDANGSLLPWNPSADATVDEIAVSTDGSRVVVGGFFKNLNGERHFKIGSLDPTSGDLEPWAYDLDPICTEGTSDVKSIVAYGANVYVGAEGTGGGCFDGTFAARASDGQLVWRDHCLGATQSVEVVGDFLYGGSHAHNCEAVANGGFPEQWPEPQHLLAESLTDGAIPHWYPNTDGNALGPRVMATDGQRLFVGGDFKKVNGVAQQGVTVFGFTPRAAPDKPQTPQLSSVQPGKVLVNVLAPLDTDTPTTTSTLLRDGQVLKTWTHTVKPWIRPVLTYEDTVAPGTSHTYRVETTDGTSTSFSQASISARTTAAGNATYLATVKAMKPTFYWRFGETGTATTAADSSGNNRTGVYRAGSPAIVKGQPGAVNDSDTAILLNTPPTQSGLVSSSATISDPRVYSLEIWFKTTTPFGGKLFGIGNAATGLSSNYDRHVYLTNAGRLIFGVWQGGAHTVQSPSTGYNNGAWHHVVAAQSGDGMRLYVDGALVASDPFAYAQNLTDGYWRVGGDRLGSWPQQPTNSYVNATVDEFALYGTALSAEQVRTHYQNAGY